MNAPSPHPAQPDASAPHDARPPAGLRVELRQPRDATLVRQRARELAAMAGLGAHEQTAFAAAVSEVARNAVVHGGGGVAELWVRDAAPAGAGPGGGHAARPAAVVAQVSDEGPGLTADRAAALGDARPGRDDGSAHGLVAAKRLSDEFEIETTTATATSHADASRAAAGAARRAGTRVTLARHLPAAAARKGAAAAVAARLQAQPAAPRTALDEAHDQNRDLLMALDAVRARQAEVERLNAELAETNRGVLALYAELDEKAATLGRVSELKTRFLSDMTHELRTPLNAMISLSRLLLDRVDGALTLEQERQVALIHRSATSLGDMVNDLLDIARIEAGKTDLHLSSFALGDLLSAQRGMFRPLVGDESRVALVVDDPPAGCPATLFSDERKLSQILRNFISNALKFTERGTVRVSVRCGDAWDAAGEPVGPASGTSVSTGAGVSTGTSAGGDTGAGVNLRFEVSDTGIGIAPEHLARMFRDYEQIDSPVQRRVRGTGLGLPLARKLARLLGGDVGVRSAPGAGSTFTLTVPARLPPALGSPTMGPDAHD